jgi:hypothetical protein
VDCLDVFSWAAASNIFTVLVLCVRLLFSGDPFSFLFPPGHCSGSILCVIYFGNC